MTLSNPGLIGGVVGFAMATALYLAVSLTLKSGTSLTSAADAEERERSGSLVRLILLADIPILTGIGYYLGQMFG